MNFEFIKELNDFKQLYTFCNEAEELISKFPSLSVTSSRKALESLVKSFYIIKYGTYPENSTLYSLIEDVHFSSYIDDSLLSCVHYIRIVGNNGAHGENVTKKEAIACLHALHETVKELLYFLGAYENAPEFDEKIYEKPLSSLINTSLITEEEVVINNKEELKKYKKYINKNIKIKSAINLSEAETRRLYIDIALKESGWNVSTVKGAIVPGTASIEVKLEGMSNNQGIGYADYILFDDDNKPLAVIEAKKTSVDEIKGSQQAKLYADCIEKKWGIRPIIFYTNGYVIKIVDNAGYPARRVYGYYSKEELHSMLIRKRGLISDTRIDPMISDRYFVQEACTSVCESFNNRHRKALIVMATGTGKTRCAISIVDVLQKYNWAKNVLFLADRTALVIQAKNSFNKYLPDSSLCVLSQETESERDYNARITLSTYQTMINMIDCEKKKYGIAKFDLIIVDECHRSVYNKYKAIFNYFDSLILGLTATPREQVDSSTYELFELPKGEPTFTYDYETAVKEGFLVDFHPFERTTNILKQGLKYEDLSDSEKEEYETIFSDENGNFPKTIDSKEFYKNIINFDTIDRVIETLMNEGLKVNNGQVLGKSIIFAVDHLHAEKIVERFKLLYPQYGDGYCKLIDNYVNYAQSLIDEFSTKDNNFRIAVSVDMLDTGIDVPEVLNLIFFKKIFSKIKLWQMIGRGTRLCKELNVYSPSNLYFEGKEEMPIVESREDKQGFYIFDFCGVFDFFRIHPDGKKATCDLNISQKIYNCKIDMVYELQKAEHQSNDEHVKYYKKYRDECKFKIQKLNRNLINVRTALKYVEAYSLPNNWNYLSFYEAKEIKKQITPLIDPDIDNESAVSFDYWIFKMELEEIIGENDYSKAIQKVITVCSILLNMQTIPQIAAKADFIRKVITNEYWENINITELEKIRLEIRELIKFLPQKIIIGTIESKFDDNVIELIGGKTPKPNFKNYKQRVMDYLIEHVDSGAIYKIRNLIPLDNCDIEELKDILCVQLGSKTDYDSIANGHDFGVFVRQIVGLDREAISLIFSKYLSQYSFNTKQQEFLHQIVDFVLQNGDINYDDLYESEPFKYQDYLDIFIDTEPLYQFVDIFHNAISVSV